MLESASGVEAGSPGAVPAGAAAISACFLDAQSGAPIEALRVSLVEAVGATPQALAAGRTSTASTDAHGRVRFTSLGEGRYRLRLDDERYLHPPGLEQAPGSAGSVDFGCIPIRRAAVLRGTLRGGGGLVPDSIELSLYAPGSSLEPIARARSEAGSGAFRFPRLDPSAAYSLSVPGPLCLPTANREIRAGGAPLILDWLPGREIHVDAFDQDSGEPVSPVELLLAPPDFPLDRPPTPAEIPCLLRAGRESGSRPVRITGLAAGEHRLALSAPGYAGRSQTLLVSDESPVTVGVPLSRAGCHDILLHDAATGEPVEGALLATDAEVFSNPVLHDLAPPTATDALGRARFCPVHPRDRDFVVHHPRYAPRSVRVSEEWGQRSAQLRIALSEGGSVAGQVWDRDGRPEPDVPVRASHHGQSIDTLTDGDGRYLLAPLAPGPITVTREETRGDVERRRSAQITEGRTTRLDFGFRPRRSVRILDGGRAISAARAVFCLGGPDEPECSYARTDERGVLDLPAGETALVVAVESDATWVFMEATTKLRKGEASLEFPSRVFAGRLLDSERRPLEGAWVLALGDGATAVERTEDLDGPPFWILSDGSASRSGPGGRLELRRPLRSSAVIVRLGSGERRSARLPETDRGEIVLEPTALLSGRAHGVRSPVRAGLLRHGQHGFARLTDGGSDGSFEIASAEPGSYLLLIWAGGLAPYAEPDFTALAGAAEERQVHLSPGGRMRLLLRDPFFDPRTSGLVTSSGVDWGFVLGLLDRVEIQAAGEGPRAALFADLPAGSYRVACGERPRKVRVREGEETTVDCP